MEPSDVRHRADGSAEFDAEGRYVELRFDTPIAQVIPSSAPTFPAALQAKSDRQAKFRFLARVLPAPASSSRQNANFVLCGDLNIAHQEIDLKNWKGNQKNSGFLPEERAWMTKAAQPKAAWSTCTASWSPRPPTTATHGGATADRPMRRT